MVGLAGVCHLAQAAGSIHPFFLRQNDLLDHGVSMPRLFPLKAINPQQFIDASTQNLLLQIEGASR